MQSNANEFIEDALDNVSKIKFYQTAFGLNSVFFGLTEDKKKERTNEQRTRYSKEELEEFKQIILKKLEEARRDLKMLTDAYTNSNENDTTDTSPTFKVLEEGYLVLSKEENSQLAARQQKFIQY